MIVVMKRRERIISVIMALVMGMSFVSPGVLAAEDTKVYDLSFDNKTYSADTTGIDFGRAGGDQWKRAQTFMALEGGKLESVEVKVTALNNPGDIIAELYATDPLGGITGEALASAEISKDQVPSGSFAEVSIPLKYDGLISGKMYAVMLTQKTVSGWYGWYCSFDATNANWWDSSVYNPQIKQPGYDDDLPSFKVTEQNEIIDDSRCGDLWLKVYYTPGETTDPDDTQKPEESLKALYEQDMENGGLSFYMDRILARPGVDPSLIEDSGLMTRGRALYTKGTNDSGLIKEFGFGGTMRYIKGNHTGYTIKINNQSASDFSEKTNKRTDYPSYWTSEYEGRASTVNDGLNVVTKRFITENNTAVTILELSNVSNSEKTVKLSMNAPYCSIEEKDSLTGQIWIDYRNINLKASMDGANIVNGNIERTLEISAGDTVSVKAQLGYIDEHDSITAEEYETYSEYTPEQAFKTHVQTYNYWWVENIPYMWVSDPVMQKMIAYRWWITRNNTVDAGTPSYPFPTAMEGVFGYNNAIVNAVPWQMDELRYLRSPVLEYGTWADAVFAAEGGIYKDNPAGVWGVKPQHYISKAGWESYKVHGGQREFLEAMAEAGAGDVKGTRETYDPDGDYLYDIQYDAWDNDTASLAIPGSQQRIDTASLAWCNANAVSEMFAAVGNRSQARYYEAFAADIKEKNLENSWDTDTKQFLMKMSDTGEFNPFRDINNYYGFMVGMIPQTDEYEQALRVWADESEFAMWPMYVSNSKDYNIIQNDSRYTDRSRNFSPGNIAITLKIFASAIKNYDSSYITEEMFGELLKNYTEMCFVNKNMNYPDTNEFWNGNPDNPYRSWIHHNFHSQYNTLLIENIMGITPRDDGVIELDPIDINLDSFKLSELRYHGHDLSVILDENGYQLFVAGEMVASVSELCHFTWNSDTGEIKILDNSQASIVYNKAAPEFNTAYDVEYTQGREAEIINTVINYQPGDQVVEKENVKSQQPPEHDGSYKLETEDGSSWEDNFNLDFGDYSADQYKRAQMFVAADGGLMTGVQVMIKNKTAVKDVTVELYSAKANGQPDKSLAKTTIPMGQVPFEGMGIVTADLEYKLEKGKAYYIVLGQESGGEGIYCWALSAKDMEAGTQAHQIGYDGDLRMYKIERSGSKDGNMVYEPDLGDFYLEVFYESVPEFELLQKTVDEAEKTILPGYLSQNTRNEFNSALNAARELLSDNNALQSQIDAAVQRLKNALSAVENQRDSKVDEVIAKINSIPAAVTLSDVKKVSDARSAYNALSSAQKNLVTNYSKLSAAEKTIAGLSNDSSVDTVVNGVKKVNGKTYLYKNGKAVTGTRIVTVSGKTYAVVKGCVRTGKSRMVTIGKKSYIVNKSGIVQKAKKGKLIKLTKTKWYVVNKSGAVQKAKKGCAVVKAGKRRYIVNKKGLVQKPKKGYKLIKAGKKKYIVNKNGFVQISKKRIKIKKTVYRTNKNGTALKR